MRLGKYRVRDFSAAWWAVVVIGVAMFWAAVVLLHGVAFGF